MSIVEAIILGIIQGLTEFLPVSSSGHIELAKYFLGSDPEHGAGLWFTILLHAATALSTIIIFRKEIGKILYDLTKFEWNDSANYAVFIVISMVPAALVGFFLKDELESLMNGNVVLVGTMLLITGVLLLFANKDRAPKYGDGLDLKKVVLIGVAQAIAILPGISRSGATISTALLTGVRKKAAAKFSFLMVLPLIFGAMAKELLDASETGSAMATEPVLPMVVGFIAAFLTGLIACKWMIKIVRKSKLTYFAVYCFIIGSFSIVMGLLD